MCQEGLKILENKAQAYHTKGTDVFLVLALPHNPSNSPLYAPLTVPSGAKCPPTTPTLLWLDRHIVGILDFYYC